MKLVVVLFMTFLINGMDHPAEDIAGDRFIPIIMPNLKICNVYKRRVMRVKDKTLPKLTGRCVELAYKYLPDKVRFHKKRYEVYKIGVKND